MTAPHKRSRGLAHSRKIKESPGWALHRADIARLRGEPPPTQWSEAEQQAACAKAERRVGRRKPEPDPKAWLKACGFDLSGIRAQLRAHYIAGYVQALRDAKREREKMERASYADAMKTATAQELATISHAYESRRS